MKIFVSGGASSGKSAFAERVATALCDDGERLYYIATLCPRDNEDLARVARHVKAREGGGFVTVDAFRDISQILDTCDKNGTFLIDSVTTLLANEMFDGGNFNANAHEKVARELSDVFLTVKNVVAVSDYIYSNAAFYGENDDLTRRFMQGLAFIDRRLAQLSSIVAEAFCGEVLYYKGCEHDFKRI